MPKPQLIAMGILAGILAIFFTVFGLTAVFNKIRVELFGKFLVAIKDDPSVDLKSTVRTFLNAPPWGFDFDKYIVTRKERQHDSTDTV